MERICVKTCETALAQDAVITRCREIYDLYVQQVFHPSTIMEMFRQTLYPDQFRAAVEGERKI